MHYSLRRVREPASSCRPCGIVDLCTADPASPDPVRCRLRKLHGHTAHRAQSIRYRSQAAPWSDEQNPEHPFPDIKIVQDLVFVAPRAVPAHQCLVGRSPPRPTVLPSDIMAPGEKLCRRSIAPQFSNSPETAAKAAIYGCPRFLTQDVEDNIKRGHSKRTHPWSAAAEQEIRFARRRSFGHSGPVGTVTGRAQRNPH